MTLHICGGVIARERSSLTESTSFKIYRTFWFFFWFFSFAFSGLTPTIGVSFWPSKLWWNGLWQGEREHSGLSGSPGLAKEHGDTYIDGIQPIFDSLKARRFDPSWNWARQDALLMYYDVIFRRLATVDRDITARAISLLNRADPDLLIYMQYNINQWRYPRRKLQAR